MHKLSFFLMFGAFSCVLGQNVWGMKGDGNEHKSVELEVVVDAPLNRPSRLPRSPMSAPMWPHPPRWVHLNNDVLSVIFSMAGDTPHSLVCYARIDRRSRSIVFSDSIVGRASWLPCLRQYFPIGERQNTITIGRHLIAFLNRIERLASFAHEPTMWRRMRALDLADIRESMSILPLGVSTTLTRQVSLARPSAHDVFQALLQIRDSMVLTDQQRYQAREASIDVLENAGSRSHRTIRQTPVIETEHREQVEAILQSASLNSVVASGHEMLNQFHQTQVERISSASRASFADRFMLVSRVSGGLAVEALELASLEGIAALATGRGDPNHFHRRHIWHAPAQGVLGPIAFLAAVCGEKLVEYTGGAVGGILGILTYPFACCAGRGAQDWIVPGANWGQDIGRIAARGLVSVPIAIAVGATRAVGLAYRGASHVLGRFIGVLAAVLSSPFLLCIECRRR
jgi:hypothetical protein